MALLSVTDYVVELQQEVERLRQLCQCESGTGARQISPATAEKLLDEGMMAHYRELHVADKTDRQSDSLRTRERASSSSSSASSSASPATPPPGPLTSSNLKRPIVPGGHDDELVGQVKVEGRQPCQHVQKKRRLHWGSDSLRSAAIKPNKSWKDSEQQSRETNPSNSAQSGDEEEEDCELCHHEEAAIRESTTTNVRSMADGDKTESDSDEDDEAPLCTLTDCPSMTPCTSPDECCDATSRPGTLPPLACKDVECQNPTGLCKNHPDSCCRHECASDDDHDTRRPSLPTPSQLFPHLSRAHWHPHHLHHHHHHHHHHPAHSHHRHRQLPHAPMSSEPTFRSLSLYTTTSTSSFPSKRYNASRPFAL